MIYAANINISLTPRKPSNSLDNDTEGHAK